MKFSIGSVVTYNDKFDIADPERDYVIVDHVRMKDPHGRDWRPAYVYENVANRSMGKFVREQGDFENKFQLAR